jgi:glyoxylase-like metal-dependent hydrolase (beta-lactamase superfamily II)
MLVSQLFDPDSSTYTYLVGDEAAGVAAVIDPVRERSDELLAAASAAGLRLLYSIDTHIHADHITAGSLLRDRTGAQVVLPALALDCGCADLTLADGDELLVGSIPLRAIHTPGHTPESLCYLAGGTHLLTGDTLMIGTCGRTDFQGGDAGALYDAVHAKLFALPDSTLVYPGHDYRGRTSSTIGDEKRTNERLVGRTREEFIALMATLNLAPPRRIAEAVPANRACGVPQQAS